MSNITEGPKKIQPYERDLGTLKSNQQIPSNNHSNVHVQDEQSQHQDLKLMGASAVSNDLADRGHHPQEAEQGQDEVPSDKDRLIEYLKETLNKAEMTMGTVLVAIQIEKDKREKIVQEVMEKKNEIEGIKSQEDNFLHEKVQDKMTSALQRALEDKVIADDEVATFEQKMNELDKEIMYILRDKELDENVRNFHREKCQKEYDANEAQYRFNEMESMIDNNNQELAKLTQQNTQKNQKIEKLQSKIEDMKGVLNSLMNTKERLNRYIKNEKQKDSRQGNRKIVSPRQVAGSNRYDEADNTYGHKANGQVFETQGRSDYLEDNNNEEDFWYSDPKNRGQPSQQAKKGNYNETRPWQPKVQNYDPASENNNFNKTPERSTIKLPTISNTNKPEYLYKSKEYIDEFRASNSKTYKQIYNQSKKRPY